MTKPETGEQAPWTVPAIGTHAYKLDIPNAIQKHCTFPVSLLHTTANDPLPGQVIPPLLPVIIVGKEEREVEEVLDSRRIRGWLPYRVKWRGFAVPTWEPEENLQAVDDYHERYPQWPVPVRLALVGTRASRGATVMAPGSHAVGSQVALPDHGGWGTWHYGGIWEQRNAECWNVRCQNVGWPNKGLGAGCGARVRSCGCWLGSVYNEGHRPP